MDRLKLLSDSRMTPVRIQLKRIKGWRMPPNTVKVDRTTRFGNPFPKPVNACGDWRTSVVAQFGDWLANTPDGRALHARARTDLAGKNLACWCPPGPCHADFLLKAANGDPTGEGGSGGVAALRENVGTNGCTSRLGTACK